MRESLEQIIDPDAKVMYSHQASLGFQRQMGNSMSVEADYTYQGERGGFYSHLMNVTYDQATGANYPFADISRRAYPLFGRIGIERYARWGNQHAIVTAWTKRFGGRWSASGTYTLSWYKDAEAQPLSGLEPGGLSPFNPTLAMSTPTPRETSATGRCSPASGRPAYGFQLSGLYFFGSGQRRATDWGGDLRGIGSTQQGGRLKPNGGIVPSETASWAIRCIAWTCVSSAGSRSIG